MAYYIFLKSLRSLEEFRKNPHVKFLINLLLQISKALLYSKIKFLFGEEFFFTFGPERPGGQSARPASQPGRPPRHPLLLRATHGRSAHPDLRGLGLIARSRLFFEFA
jgi:hypothetical protein